MSELSARRPPFVSSSAEKDRSSESSQAGESGVTCGPNQTPDGVLDANAVATTRKSRSSAMAKKHILDTIRQQAPAEFTITLMENLHRMYRNLTAMEISRLKDWLMALVKNGELVRIAKGVGAYVRAHPGLVLGLLLGIGIVLIANPLALVGFGSMGPIAGSIAAAWQASIGNVAAGSLFAMLQSIGMVHAITIPVVGGVVLGGTSLVALKAANVLRPASQWIQGKAVRAWGWMKTTAGY